MGQTAEELRADIEARREQMTGTVDEIGDRVLPGRILERRKDAARGWVDRSRRRLMGAPHAVAERVPDTDLTGRASAGAHQVADTISHAPDQLADQTRGAPLVAGGIAFGLGVLLALVVPESDTEMRLGAQVQPQVSAATDAAVESAKETAQQTFDAAKESAQDSAQELKETATEHAGEMRNTAKSAGEDVADSARRASSS